MKNLLFALCLLLSVSTFSQVKQNSQVEDSKVEVLSDVKTETESPYSYYVAAGISLANFDSDEDQSFNSTSYASVELGVMRDNMAVAGVFGISSLDQTDSYWYEGKVMFSKPLGVVDGYGILGVGSYVDNTSLFLEYGVGVTREFNGWGVFAQVSNWDSLNYISTGVSVCLF